MSTKSKIEWTDATWNPVRGCSRVSEGCRNCYAERQALRFSGRGEPYYGLVTRGSDGKPHWTGKVDLFEHVLLQPLHWRGAAGGSRKRLAGLQRVFVNSMSDLFHEGLTDEQIDRVFAVMALCPQHTFQVLTKRAKRMREWVEAWAEFWRGGDSGDHAWRGAMQDRWDAARRPLWEYFRRLGDMEREEQVGVRLASLHWPLPNVWLGVSVEDRTAWDERVRDLKATPAAVRFVSYEPALGALGEVDLSGLDWVICGGESGPGARPMHPDWARAARDACQAAGVAFFFKQWGEWEPHVRASDAAASKNQGWLHAHGMWIGDFDDAHCEGGGWQAMRRVGKRAAGRVLDGRTWDGFPEGRA